MNYLIPSSLCLALTLLVLNPAPANAAEAEGADGWIRLFDGESLDGWKTTQENPKSWKVEDGAIVAFGPRSHLFYLGGGPYKNFEFKADVMTEPGSNSGIFLHTQYQDEGWPTHGYEVQINNTHRDPVKTGSLYNTVKLFESAAQDKKWWTQKITVQDNHVTVEIDGKQVVDYPEPADKAGPVKLSQGTFALQAHDPDSVVHFKNIYLKPLP